MKIGSFRIPVSDLATAIHFYTKTLDFQLEFSFEQYGWAQISKEDISIGLYLPGKGGGDRQPGGSLDFRILDTEIIQLHRKIKSKTTSSISEIRVSDDGLSYFDITDNSGNVISFLQDRRIE